MRRHNRYTCRGKIGTNFAMYYSAFRYIIQAYRGHCISAYKKYQFLWFILTFFITAEFCRRRRYRRRLLLSLLQLWTVSQSTQQVNLLKLFKLHATVNSPCRCQLYLARLFRNVTGWNMYLYTQVSSRVCIGVFPRTWRGEIGRNRFDYA